MDTTLATANALQRLLLKSLLTTRFGPVAPRQTPRCPPPPDAGETLPMLYRSEAFAEDLPDFEAPAR